MRGDIHFVGETALRFFGKMSASISHEIKNVLAIINENAGLLEDFTLMAKKGIPLDPERLKKLSGMVIKQIQRGDEIIKNMNRFSHSIDESSKKVDLYETLDLMVALSARFASMRGVILDFVQADSDMTSLSIKTNRFYLENLIWLCLDFAMDAAGSGKTVGLSVEQTGNSGRICFMHLENLNDMPSDTFPNEEMRALLETIKAEIITDIGEKKLILNIFET